MGGRQMSGLEFGASGTAVHQEVERATAVKAAKAI